jgi:Spy/CpxP family protein refolding chaperone
MKNVILSLLSIACTLLVQEGAYAGTTADFEMKLLAEHSERSLSPKFTDAQLESIHAIKTKYLEADESNISQLHLLHRKSFELMSGVSLNKEDLMLVQSKINATEAELANQRLRMAIELHDVLTPEQKDEMHKHMLEREAGPGGLAGPGGPGGSFASHGPGGGMMPSCFGPGMPPSFLGPGMMPSFLGPGMPPPPGFPPPPGISTR